MSHDNVYPDTDSAEYKATEKSIRQTIRLLLAQGHAFEPVKLLSSTEVQVACNGVYIPKELLNSIVMPNIDCRDWVWEMYVNKQHWSVDEAVSLAAGFDPLMFTFFTSTFLPLWCQIHKDIHEKVLVAIESNQLPMICKDGVDYVEPYAFCHFALGAELVDEWTTDFFESMSLKRYSPLVEALTLCHRP